MADPTTDDDQRAGRELLDLQPLEDLPSWCTPALLATQSARDRIKAWVELGKPATDGDAIVRRLNVIGSISAQSIIRGHLAAGSVAPPAAWYLVEHVATYTIGLEARGLAIVPPPPRIERLLIIDDGCEAQDVLSTWLHEAAHAWQLPLPPAMTDLELVTYSGPLCDVAAVEAGCDMAKLLRDQQRSEREACRLAEEWGATGPAVDPAWCEQGPEVQLSRAQAAMAEDNLKW